MMATSTLVARMPVPTRAAETNLASMRIIAAAGFLLGVVLAVLGFARDPQRPERVQPHRNAAGGVRLFGCQTRSL